MKSMEAFIFKHDLVSSALPKLNEDAAHKYVPSYFPKQSGKDELEGHPDLGGAGIEEPLIARSTHFQRSFPKCLTHVQRTLRHCLVVHLELEATMNDAKDVERTF